MTTLVAYLDRWLVPDHQHILATRDVPHWIDNLAVVFGTPIRVTEPATGAAIARTFEAGQEGVSLAIASAQRAFVGDWSRLRPLDRQTMMLRLADLIERHADDLALLECLNVGKPLAQARTIDVGGSVDVLRHFAGFCTRLDGRAAPLAAYGPGHSGITLRKPVGIVAAIAPWNFPLQTLVWKCAAAFAAGCVVIAKPSEVSPITALRLGELVAEAGFPPGVLNIVNGTGVITGAALVADPRIHKISFTGSTASGVRIGQAALPNLTRLTLELGGKSAAIVAADADLDVAVAGVVNGIFFNAGQVCDATSRLVVDASIADEFMERLVQAAGALRMGEGLDPDTFMGPLVSQAHRDKVFGYVSQAREDGLALALDRAGCPDDGRFCGPVIVADCPTDHGIWREEIFGPILAMQRADGVDGLLSLAADSDFGLGASVYSRNTDTVLQMARSLRTGTVYVNGHGFLDPAFPFGGFGKSGFGRDLGPDQMEAYLETTSVLFAAC